MRLEARQFKCESFFWLLASVMSQRRADSTGRFPKYRDAGEYFRNTIARSVMSHSRRSGVCTWDLVLT